MTGARPKNRKGRIIGRSRHTPERTCIGCRTKRQARDLLRLSCTPQGDVFPDASGRAPGRGGYVCFDVACMRQALKPGKLASALKQPVNDVSSVDSLCQSAIHLLHARLGSYLSLAQKAGVAISGATPLHKALTQRQVRYMVLAEDMAATRAEGYHRWCHQQSIPWLTLFSKDELGRLLGKPERSAVGLTDMRFGELMHATATTLRRLQADSGCAEAPCDRAISSSL